MNIEKHTLSLSVARSIESDFLALGMTILPSITRLAESYHVSRATIMAALHYLKEQGVLAAGHRRRATVAAKIGRSNGEADLKGMAAATEAIRSRISEGAIAAGEPIGKIAVWAANLGVSLTTICKALNHLQSMGVVHKHGKAWYAGIAPGQTDTKINVFFRPVILLICTSENAWHATYNERTQAFAQAFESEARRHGVQIRTGLTDTNATSRAGLCAGPQEIGRFISSLGNRYRGALLVDFDLRYLSERKPTAIQPEFEMWISLLRPFGRPTVWFDRYNRLGKTLERPNPEPANVRQSSAVFRCHFDEELAVRMVLEHFQEFGHKAIGAPVFRDGWAIRRQQLVIESAEMCKPVVRIEAPQFNPEDIFSATSEKIAEQLRYLHKEGIGPVKNHITAQTGSWNPGKDAYRSLAESFGAGKISQRFFSWAPAIAACLRHPDVTALIASNDLTARHIWEWMALANIRIPQDVSLISFDDSPAIHPFPVSSVNFGFDDLGYQAFHAIHQVVPIRSRRNGDITSRSHVADRGSVGPPSKRRIWRRFVGTTE